MGLTALRMPQLGESVTEGTVDRWLKKEGELVVRDEPLVEVVTDKVNAEVPSPFQGRLVRIEVAEGTTVPIGTVLAQFDVDEAAAAAAPPAAEAPAPAAPPAASSPTWPARSAAAGDGAARQRLSPVVRRLAAENDVDLTQVAGTGAGGRVTRQDVLGFLEARAATQPAAPVAAAPQSPAGAREELVRVSAVRRQIAEHMVRSKHTSPHAWGMREVDMSALVTYRDARREDFAQRHGISLTYLPFVIHVVCDALRANPYLNASWTDEGIVLKHYLNIGVAVALPDALIVPVIRDADQLGLVDLARAISDLATRARTRTLRPEDVRDGTFTVNNTGAIGSIQGMAIINQPQAAILSTEKIVKRPVVVDDEIVIRPIMYLTMSFDHRIVDGLQAGRFLDAVQDGLERWTPASIRL
ncbi:MAG TPA: dihydrolipoamide acetyltransferase family protein [Candidatus Dormibacteraeota bacterium]|nr:dihydrolipoamide acetyltransferase family protein [Candidatus Dormibacteraeota bacterium]